MTPQALKVQRVISSHMLRSPERIGEFLQPAWQELLLKGYEFLRYVVFKHITPVGGRIRTGRVTNVVTACGWKAERK